MDVPPESLRDDSDHKEQKKDSKVRAAAAGRGGGGTGQTQKSDLVANDSPHSQKKIVDTRQALRPSTPVSPQRGSPPATAETSQTQLLGGKQRRRSTNPDIMVSPAAALSNSFRDAHEQLEYFFENSMLDLRRREIEIEGVVLLSKRRLMAMSKEAYLAGEADQKRVDLLASQKKKSELLLGHETEARRQRQDAAAKKEALFVEASASKARSLKMQQLQEMHELALALNQGAGDRAPAFAREVAFLQRQQNEQRGFIKEIQTRRALNLDLRQAAVRSTKKDIDARFLKREQDREKQSLKEFGEREAEQLRSIQALQLLQSQDLFDQREQQHRVITQVQAQNLMQQQELRAHHLEMKRTAKLGMLVKMFQVKEAERQHQSVVKTEELLLAQELEAKQLLNAQKEALDSRIAARLLDEKHARVGTKLAAERTPSVLDGGSEANPSVDDGFSAEDQDNPLNHEYSMSAQTLLSAALLRASELEAAQEKERKIVEERQRDAEKQRLFKRKEEVLAEIEREKAMVAIAKRQMESDLSKMVSGVILTLFLFARACASNNTNNQQQQKKGTRTHQ